MTHIRDNNGNLRPLHETDLDARRVQPEPTGPENLPPLRSDPLPWWMWYLLLLAMVLVGLVAHVALRAMGLWA